MPVWSQSSHSEDRVQTMFFIGICPLWFWSLGQDHQIIISSIVPKRYLRELGQYPSNGRFASKSADKKRNASVDTHAHRIHNQNNMSLHPLCEGGESIKPRSQTTDQPKHLNWSFAITVIIKWQTLNYNCMSRTTVVYVWSGGTPFGVIKQHQNSKFTRQKRC